MLTIPALHEQRRGTFVITNKMITDTPWWVLKEFQELLLMMAEQEQISIFMQETGFGDIILSWCPREELR